MRVLLAPDSFKGSLGAAEAAAAMARGVEAAGGGIDLCPLADGGEGTLDVLSGAMPGAEVRQATVTGPLGRPVTARWLLDGTTAVVELAQAAGLERVPADRRNPRRTTTFGVGELIRHALDAGATELLLTLGGSATNDGGAGCAQALGWRFRDTAGCVHPPITGGDLARLVAVDGTGVDPRLRACRVRAACDVTNPLCGAHGAAAVFGPQKGADAAAVTALDAGLARLAALCPHANADAPGTGAAGGMGFGAVAFLGAALEPGIDLVLDAVRFRERASRADLILTGEGRFDATSLRGKVISGVLRGAGATPVIALVGSAGPAATAVLPPPLRAVRVIAPDLPLEDSLRDAATHLERAARAVVESWRG